MSSKVVLPGEIIQQVPENGQLRLGPGIVGQGDEVLATKSGVLKQAKSGQTWLEGRQKRYIPSEGDVVVGTIVDRYGENFTVDIGAPFLAQLPQLSFEGATRRNRPAVKAGDLVYCRVVSAFRDTEPILSCVDTLGRASGFGHLKEGYVFKVSTSLARRLLSNPPPHVLKVLGEHEQFELAPGLNGRVWVYAPPDSQEPLKAKRTCIVVANAIMKSEFLTDRLVEVMVAQMLK